MPNSSARGQWKSTDVGSSRIAGHLFYLWWPSPGMSLPQEPHIEFFPKRTSAVQLSLAPAKKERATVQEWGSNHHEPTDHVSTLTPGIASPSRWEASAEPWAQMPCAHTEHELAVPFFLIFYLITSFQSRDQYCQHTAAHPTRHALLSLLLFLGK